MVCAIAARPGGCHGLRIGDGSKQSLAFNKQRLLTPCLRPPCLPLPCNVVQPVAWKPAPRGNKTCPSNCNNLGNCNYDTGYCECTAGWLGPDCKTVGVWGGQRDGWRKAGHFLCGGSFMWEGRVGIQGQRGGLQVTAAARTP